MAEFVVKIADERGHLLEQIENGYSEAEVRDRFVQQGFLVYWVKPRGVLSGGLSRRGKVKQGQFLIFNSQFLTLIKAGLPILNSLDLLIKRQRNPYLQSLLQNVRDRVKAGELLSDAFSGQGAFPKIYTSTLMAGEKSGNMEEVLTRYIAFQRMALTFKKKLAVSLVYPTLLVTVVTIMLVFLVTYVVPQFARLYEDMGAELPVITLIMLNIGNHAQRYLPLFGIAVVITVLAFWQWKKTDRGAERIDRVILALPLLGEIWLKYQVSNFSRMLSTLLAGVRAAGAVVADCRCLDEQPAHLKWHIGCRHSSARGATAGQKPRRTKDVSRVVGGDDRGRRIHWSHLPVGNA